MIAWAVRRSSRLGGCTHSCWNNELVVLQRIVRGDARCAEKNAVRMAEGFADDCVLLPPSNKQTENYDGGKHGATHQVRQPFQLGERRFTIQPRHDWSKLLSQSPEDSSLAEDVERSYRQCSSRSRRTRSQYDPALVHQARHRPLFSWNGSIGESFEDGVVVGVLTRASL